MASPQALNGSAFYEDTGNEFRIPPWADILKAENIQPILVYFVLFRMASFLAKRYTWTEYTGFKQYRLRNLSICFIHSVISATIALTFSVTHLNEVLFNPMHWYQHCWRHGLLFSAAYFLHDTIDMLEFELSKFTAELLLHHFCCVFVFVVTVTSRKFLPYAYCALLMEVNSVTLHLRTLMQLSGTSTQYIRTFRAVQYANIFTFLVFRFCVQVFELHWAIVNISNMHVFFFLVGTIGGITFLIINSCLFLRILASDGFLGDAGRNAAAINRWDGLSRGDRDD
uniref:TLC domain-containing protein n=1 Tax=Panagrellus redivivus TaxID=6233 RepID=A0A7E4UZS9_PANRE